MPLYMTYQFENIITILLMVVAAIVVIAAQAYITSTYKKYKKISNKLGISGSEVAIKMLEANGLSHVYVVETTGELTDHYDPTRKVIKLSKDIFHGETIAGIAVAAHECGHAIQDKEGYKPMRIRASLVPFVNLVSYAGYFAILIGAFAGIMNTLYIGIAMLCATLLFQVVTLPVEFDASRRALKALEKNIKLSSSEVEGAESMLKAAAFTYVAGVISTLLNILRLVLMNRDRD